jgi:D-alanyl-lipoteichoic acid acyltransferase DltB (MBOAT superfamily)
LYIPLGGSQGGTWTKVRNTFVIFLVSGFWHGAKWTFIVWGALNAIYFLPLLLTNKNRNNLEIVAKGKIFPSVKEFLSMSLTFSLTVFAWIFFRADNIGHAVSYISGIFSSSFFVMPRFEEMKKALAILFIVVIFVLVEWQGRECKYAIAQLDQKWNRPFKWCFYSFIIFIIGMYLQSEETPFIYFQF